MNRLRGTLKAATLSALELSGCYSLASLYRKSRLLVACYHGVLSQDHSADPALYGNTVSAAEFADQLEFLGGWFEFVDLAGAMKWLQDGPQTSKPPVLITFDDGYRNNLTVAAPILRRVGAPAVFFLTTGYIGTGRLLWPLELEARLVQSHPGPEGRRLAFERRAYCKSVPNASRLAYLDELRASTMLDPGAIDREMNDFLTWDEVRQLAVLGFDLGSHTVEHPMLSRLTPSELRQELTESRARIASETGSQISVIAYPNGETSDLTPVVRAASAEAGYTHAFAVGGHFSTRSDDPFAIRRWIVYGHQPPSIFRFTVSGLRDLIGFS
ncbi:MAG TPA: polysaccharide deacetylase family protein [Bryobacteraceae bacterium]|nr:polysaccharide deacetylase family protein [Bryobacteraceae bacterium]